MYKYTIISAEEQLCLKCLTCEHVFIDCFDAITWHDNCEGEQDENE